MWASERRLAAGALALLLAPTGLAAQVRTAEPAPAPTPPPKAWVAQEPVAEPGYSITVMSMRRALLGVTASVEPEPTDDVGALLTAVTPGGPADRAGLRSGDLIVRLGGVTVSASDASGLPGMRMPAGLRLVELAARLGPNDTVVVEYRRGRRNHTTTLITSPAPGYAVARVAPEARIELERNQQLARMLNERQRDLERVRGEVERVRTSQRVPDAPRGSNLVWLRSAGPLAGLELVTVNPSLEAYFGTGRGILVVKAADPAPFGLSGGDVILAVDGREPASASHLYRILATYSPAEVVRLDVIRRKKPLVLKASLAEPIPAP